ncbi:hypothetical protein ACHAXN_007624 [Cyclotella atomus]
MNSLRNLHSIGIDHSHDNLFDVDSLDYLDGTGSTLLTSTDDDVEMAMELENRNRIISTSIIFSVLMVAYLGFCCFYHKKKIRQRIGDSLHQQQNGAVISRAQRRADNRAVLDQSSNAASRALRDGEMARKLEERKKKIQNVLVTRLVVDKDFLGESSQFQFVVADERIKVNVEDELTDVTNIKSFDGDASIAPGVTQCTSEETNESNTHDNNPSQARKGSTGNQDAAVSTITTANTSSTCIDLKKLSSSISNCGNSSHNCSTSNNACLDSTMHLESSHDQSKVLMNEECNICLSAFQVGDRIAWSRTKKSVSFECEYSNDSEGKVNSMRCVLSKDTACHHIFHAECIERWLLVREECPVCRRNYFDEEKDGDEIQQLEDGDLEAGEITGANTGVNLSPARVVTVEE